MFVTVILSALEIYILVYLLTLQVNNTGFTLCRMAEGELI